MIYEKRRKAFLTKGSRLVKFTKKGAMNMGISEDEFVHLAKIGFIKVSPLTICSECHRTIEDDDCQYCGHEGVGITTHDFYMYNAEYNGTIPLLE